MNSALLSSTPPVVGTPPAAGGVWRRGPASGAVCFRGAPDAGDAGAGGGSFRLHHAAGGSLGSGSLSGRSLSRSSRGTLGGSSGVARAPAPRVPTVEGFAVAESPPASPPPPRGGAVAGLAGAGRAASLLSRELSHSELALGSPLPLALSPAGGLGLAPGALPPPPASPRLGGGGDGAPEGAMLAELQARHAVFSEPLARRAFTVAKVAAERGGRGAGFTRCAAAADRLASLGADEAAVAAALLHGALEGGSPAVAEAQLRPLVDSAEAMALAAAAARMRALAAAWSDRAGAAEGAAEGGDDDDDDNLGGGDSAGQLVALLVAMDAPKAALVALAAALADVKYAAAGPLSRRAARAALALWAPLANRLGIWPLKAALEDAAFRALRPAAHAAVAARLAQLQSPAALVALVERARAALAAAGVAYLDLSARPKHAYGVWRKLRARGLDARAAPAGALTDDARGLRVVVAGGKEDCYRALRALTDAFGAGAAGGAPRVKDYIRAAKPNGYQSLHAVVAAADGAPAELQVRTRKMHYLAEYGAAAAHWRYKEGKAAGAGASASAAAPAPAPATASALGSIDDDDDAAVREASWARFVAQGAVTVDAKCRPAGSPPRDEVLAAPPPGDARFAAYLASSGQVPAAAAAGPRLLVAVAAPGAPGLGVAELPPGARLGDLLGMLALGAGGAPGRARPRVTVNGRVEADAGAALATGDLVEVAPPAAAAGSPPRSNVVPLPAGMLRRAAAAAAAAAN